MTNLIKFITIQEVLAKHNNTLTCDYCGKKLSHTTYTKDNQQYLKYGNIHENTELNLFYLFHIPCKRKYFFEESKHKENLR